MAKKKKNQKRRKMNKLLLPIFTLVFITPLFSSAQLSELRYFNESNINNSSYSPSILPTQVMRMDLQEPGILRKIELEFSGSSGSGATLRLLGHEAGTSFPQLEKDLIEPIEFTKSGSGRETISIDLEEEVMLRNDQFFIVMENFTSDATWLVDPTDYPIPCESGSGGNYRYMFFKNLQGNWTSAQSNTTAAVTAFIEPIFSGIPYLQDITQQSGFSTNHSNRSIAVADYNDDGWLDIMVDQHLYKNEKNASFADVSSQLGITDEGRLNTFTDVDNDGDIDILIFGVGNGTEARIYVNDGNGSFNRENLSGLPAILSPTSISIADVNNDNYPDVFIGQLWSPYPVPLSNHLLVNNGNLGFNDETSRIYAEYDGTNNYPSGVACEENDQSTWQSGNNKNRRSRGSIFSDFDNDGDLDLYVTNYFLERDEFYENDGNGNFSNIISSTGIDVNNTGSNHGTGVDFADYDNDGDLDILLPQFAHPRFVEPYDHRPTTIYNNPGNGGYDFKDTKDENGIAFEETHAGGAFGDINNDGLLDFAITTYYGCRYMDVYLQNNDHSFDLNSYRYGVNDVVTGEDVIWADINNDGKLDLLSGENNRFRLYVNDHPVAHRYVEFDLKGNNNSMGIGSKVKVYSDGKMQMREVNAGRGQRMQKPARVHFGLQWASSIDSVVVDWYNGDKEVIETGIEPYKIYSLEQGKGVSSEIESGNDPDDLIALGREDEIEVEVKPYPNPFSDHIEFKINESSVSGIELLVFNEDGRLVKKQIFELSPVILKTSEIPKGQYFYTLKMKGEIYSGKISKLD